MTSRFFSLGLAMLFCVGTAAAQLTVANTGVTVPPASATTTGSLHSLETVNAPNIQVGLGSIQRAAGNANTAFLPTGWAIDPASTVTGPAGQNAGFSIEFWYKPAQPGLFAYLFGDANWVGPTGAFRCFQNGAAGVNNVIIRGPSAQLATTTGPLVGGINANGFVHLAFTYDSSTSLMSWYVNGVPSGSINATMPGGTGTNLTTVGYNGSAAPGPEGFTDDLRCYAYARSAADIMFDYMTGMSPNNLPAVGIDTPDYYYEFELPQNAHTGVIATGTDAEDTGNRLFTTGTTISWGANSPQVDPLATAILNFEGPTFGTAAFDARPLQYRTPPAMNVAYTTLAPAPVPGLEMGHNFSTPVNPASLAFVDGLGLGTFGIFAAAIPAPYVYSAPNIGLPAPGIFQPGDAVHIQFIAPDATFAGGIAVTNRTTFLYVDPDISTNGNGTTIEHCRVEARGLNNIQNTGFFEIWNTGTDSITQVTIDISTLGAANMWDPAGMLNSGGTLATLDSFRFNSEIYCGLNTATVPTAGMPTALTFDFTSFEGPLDHFVFDCDTVTPIGGALFAGATVSVTFASGVTLTGVLAADPADPEGSLVDL